MEMRKKISSRLAVLFTPLFLLLCLRIPGDPRIDYIKTGFTTFGCNPTGAKADGSCVDAEAVSGASIDISS